MNIIDVKDVSLRYPASKIDTIQGISFSVQQGEIFGFLGPSGAGKSTLQKILTGTLRNYQGSVRVFDTEVKQRTSQYYEHIGVDFEFPNFYSKFSALENLNYFGSLYASAIDDPMALLERVGLHQDANKKVRSYSKGMKMRLGFIRSIMHNPQLLFLDEPTSGLDPSNARIVKDMILEQKRLGKTIILTTHNMQDAKELCDRVAFIVNGTIKAVDSPDAFCKGGLHTTVEYACLVDGVEEKHSCELSNLNHANDFQSALQAGRLTSIHSKEQTLEDVFISLTGRGLQ